MRNETKFSYFNRRRCVPHENVLDFRTIRIDEMMKSRRYTFVTCELSTAY